MLYNLTTGSFLKIGGGAVSETLMARDYKDPQCVVIEDDIPEEDRSDHGEQPSGQLLRTGCIQRYVDNGEK